MKTERVKGFEDFVGIEAEKKSEIKRILSETFELYGFQPLETPIIEYEEFVKGNSNSNSQDEAISDVFKLKDKGKRNLALRYEFTFQLKRVANNKKLPYKRYQIGEVFRDEPSSGGKTRLRQFTQADIDVVGSTIKDEAEILSIANETLIRLGVKPIILFNNRKLLNEVLSDQGVKEKDREQVLREIDKYDKIGESKVKENLKKFKAENVIEELKKGEKYFNQFQSYKEIISLMEYCKLYGLQVQFAPTVVRGLSYYDGSVFEIKAKGIKETICAGGSYEINGIPCSGISFGIERLSTLSKNLDSSNREKILIISLDQDKEAIKLARNLRKKNIVSIYYGKPSKALDYANSYNMSKVIFVGEKEVKTKKFKIKDMKTGKESSLKL